MNQQLCDQKAGWRSLGIILVMALIAIFVYVYVAPKMPLFFDDVGFLEPYEPKIEEPGRFLYLAKQGNAKAQFFLGAMYMAGIGVPQDNTKAAKWLREAGAQHNSDIDSTLQAAKWIRKAADQGNPVAQWALGDMYLVGQGVPQNDFEAGEWLRKAADQGNSFAQFYLGGLYFVGRGVPQDYAKAREWYEKASDKGYARAMTNLGVFYENGDGVAQDYAKAREWYEKAAEKGDERAMTNLGELYANGQGVAQDYAKAREWYEKAAEKGDERAMTNLGWLYESGQGVAQDYAKAREWYEKASDKGYARAMTNLGVFYENGDGVAQDYAKAREWYEKAAEKGDERAKTNLERLPIRAAAGAGRYDEALQLQEMLTAETEAAETKREGKPGKETANALISVAWYALFARKFEKALIISSRAHTLLPANLVIETNRAHALMFLGRRKESETLYLAYKGKPISEQDNRLWERVIADDFAEFRKAGLTHPMMADIDKELGVSR